MANHSEYLVDLTGKQGSHPHGVEPGITGDPEHPRGAGHQLAQGDEQAVHLVVQGALIAPDCEEGKSGVIG